MKKTPLFLSFLLGGILLIFLLFGLFRYRASLYSSLQSTGVMVEIAPEMTAVQIADLLFEKGVIKNKRWFIKTLRKRGVDGKLKAGIYEFRGTLHTSRVITMIVKGEIARMKVVIPEGYNLREIAGVLESYKISTRDEFLAFATREGLEGFLFPDTYLFPINVKMETVARTMVDRFWEVLKEIRSDVDSLSKEELKKIVTIASIVEKEAYLKSEKPVIAAIFYNRLRKRIPLQSCSSVIYVIGPRKKLTLSETRINSPYNTYRHTGLPPTPISNPGKDALSAAFFPAKTNYLFFLAKGDGSHYFSTTYREHLAAKNRYQTLSSSDSGLTQEVRE
jgi:UPF0755 protein